MALRRPPTRVEIKPEEALDEFEEVCDCAASVIQIACLFAVHEHSSIPGPTL
jgi:hypothetical protein